MKKAVIFDMDGVIVESEDAHIEVEKQIMLKRGIRISNEELHKYTGSTARFMFAKLIEKYSLKDSVEDMENEKEETLLKLVQNDMKPTKGVITLIKKLKKLKVKLGVASGSSRQSINCILGNLKIVKLFDAIVGAEDIQHSKPDPEIFLVAAQKLKVKPFDCVVIEDAYFGVEAAKQAGMKCIGYRNPHSGDQNLSKADNIIESFSGLEINFLLS